jgi:hypothetical protein
MLCIACELQECARYIETLKAYENKPASSIMEARDTDYLGRLTAALTAVRGVNRCGCTVVCHVYGVCVRYHEVLCVSLCVWLAVLASYCHVSPSAVVRVA